jgi:phosphatidylglycerol:prolipoprotein diacylglycerol transferase
LAAPSREAVPGTRGTAPKPQAAAGAAAGRAGHALQPVLMPTCWLDPGDRGKPFRAVVHFSGRRLRETGKPQPDEWFTHEETVDGIIPGSGPVAVTAEVQGITAGKWTVTAWLVSPAGSRKIPLRNAAGMPAQGRGSLLPRGAGTPVGPIWTMPRPLAGIPGVTPLAYPGLLASGLLAGLMVQALLLGTAGLPWVPALGYSVCAVLAGLAGAKAWHLVTRRRRALDGWCVPGLLLGPAVFAGMAPAAGVGIAAGAYFSTAAAGLFTGMAIGWPGCFWAGRGVGRPTASRWGIWSSDRRVGCRRVPVPLIEALLALATASVAAAAVVAASPAEAGAAAIAASAAYACGRQLITGLYHNSPRRPVPLTRWRHHDPQAGHPRPVRSRPAGPRMAGTGAAAARRRGRR